MRRMLSLFLLAPLSPLSAAIIDVTSTSGAGSIQDAITQVNALGGGPHTIRYAASFPSQTAVLLSAALPQITASDVTIDGNGREPVIDGGGNFRIFQIGPNTTKLTLQRLTLRNGKASNGNGGCVDSTNVRAVAARLVVAATRFENCKVTGTSLIYGGAIYWNATGTPVSISDSVFIGNIAEATGSNGQTGGGAIYSNGVVSVLNSRFESNLALSDLGGGFGGAMFLRGANASHAILDSNFIFNGASPASPIAGLGGAIYGGCDNCSVQVQRSYFRGNSANHGGAVYVRKPSAGDIDTYLTLTNVTLYNNSVAQRGGAVYLDRTGFTASNNTFYNGDATDGAHIYFGNNVNVDFFRGNLLAPAAFGSACAGTPTSLPSINGGNLHFDSGCASVAGTSIPNAPLGTITVDEPANGVGVLHFSGSAVIDSLAPSQCEPRDARFQQRPIDGDGDGVARCDVGAYEYQPRIFGDSFE